MFKLVSLLLILPVIYAHVRVDVTSKDGQDVTASGSSVRTVTEADMKTFGLTEEVLRKSVWSYFGALPDNVFYKSPTLWGDLYKTLNWEPVKMTMSPINTSVLSVAMEPTLVMTKHFFNNKTEDLDIKTDISQTFVHTVSASWDKEGELGVEKIRHGFDFDTAMDQGYFSFLSKWGEDFESTWPMTLHTEVQVTLKPDQHLIAEVYATKRTAIMRVDFETTLSGTVAINFDKEYKGHRFWSLDINTLLLSDGLKRSMYSSEMLELLHFTEASVVFKDALTQEIVSRTPVHFH
ncbi:uncharacterized protein LOC116775600 [Danaus plexippus]|uniref:uncharacterized protein LOC116775600 n=1 Tax=Danaus plexippus TaxID=13037 RepID=UPI002AB27231|nr:uncharacterized protein LOC116775600 [Danaus plexippus]